MIGFALITFSNIEIAEEKDVDDKLIRGEDEIDATMFSLPLFRAFFGAEVERFDCENRV